MRDPPPGLENAVEYQSSAAPTLRRPAQCLAQVLSLLAQVLQCTDMTVL